MVRIQKKPGSEELPSLQILNGGGEGPLLLYASANATTRTKTKTSQAARATTSLSGALRVGDRKMVALNLGEIGSQKPGKYSEGQTSLR